MMNQLPTGIGSLAQELLDKNLPLSQRHSILDAALISPTALKELSGAMGLQLHGAQKVSDVLGRSNIEKSPLPNIRIYRIDLGWQEANGNFGIIKDDDLPPDWKDICLAIMEQADATRANFSTFFGFHSVGKGYRVLMCNAPIPGGFRGTASTSQILLFKEQDIPYGANLSDLMNALPPLPDTIGAASRWNIKWTPKSTKEQLEHQDLISFNLARMNSWGSDFYVEDDMNGQEKMKLILDTFSMTPIEQRANFNRRLTTHVSGGPKENPIEGMDRKSVKVISKLKGKVPDQIPPNVLEIHQKLKNRFGPKIFDIIPSSLNYKGVINNIVSCLTDKDLGIDHIRYLVQGIALEFGEKSILNILQQSFELLMQSILKDADDGRSKKIFFHLFQGSTQVNQSYALDAIHSVIQNIPSYKSGIYVDLYLLLKSDGGKFGFPILKPISFLLEEYPKELPISNQVFQSILEGLVKLAGRFPGNIPHLSKEQRNILITYGQANLLHSDIKTALLESAGMLEKLQLKISPLK